MRKTSDKKIAPIIVLLEPQSEKNKSNRYTKSDTQQVKTNTIRD